MITKETARQIYNCHQQLEEIANIKEDMRNEVERVREQEKKDDRPISERDCSFGKYGKGMQLGVPEIAIKVMDEQEEALKRKLNELEAIAKIELGL